MILNIMTVENPRFRFCKLLRTRNTIENYCERESLAVSKFIRTFAL